MTSAGTWERRLYCLSGSQKAKDIVFGLSQTGIGRWNSCTPRLVIHEGTIIRNELQGATPPPPRPASGRVGGGLPRSA